MSAIYYNHNKHYYPVVTGSSQDVTVTLCGGDFLDDYNCEKEDENINMIETQVGTFINLDQAAQVWFTFEDVSTELSNAGIYKTVSNIRIGNDIVHLSDRLDLQVLVSHLSKRNGEFEVGVLKKVQNWCAYCKQVEDNKKGDK